MLKEINDIYRAIGLRKAERESFLWYKDARTDDTNTDVMLVQQPKMHLSPGKIHIFTYNPKHKDTLDYYDKKPVVISIGRIQNSDGSYLDLGININFIPAPYKWYILNILYTMHKEFFDSQMNGPSAGNAIEQKRIRYKYDKIKKLLVKYGFTYAIRTYIPERKSRVYVVSYESWIKCAFLSIENFEGITYEEMIKQYKDNKKR